ncbi:MAG: protein translocase subunit SecD [Paracoccaceae bacterium]
MLEMPLWKRLFVLIIVAFGMVYALPNLFYARVEAHNDALAEVALTGIETPETEAARALWPDVLPSSLVNLGLDLRGGASLLAEVQVREVYKQRLDAFWPQARDALKEVRDQVGPVRREDSSPDGLRIAISNPEGMEAAVTALRALAQPVASLTGAGSTDFEITGAGQILTVTLSEAEQTATDSRTLQQSLEIIRRRVDEAGTREPTILRQGQDRILIEVPGLGSAQELKDIIGTTAKLTFNQVTSVAGSADAPVGPGQMLLPDAADDGRFYIVEELAVVSGEDLTDAQPSFDQNNRPAVNFRFGPSGARAFGDYTATHIGEPFAIVLDNEVISAPTIQSHIPGGSGIITGNFSLEESTNLAVLLRAGALPAKIVFLEEKTVGPELGQDSIDAGKVAAVVAMLAVAGYMVASYGLFGTFAVLALGVNVALIFGFLSMIGGTLTLPGIAGLVLTIGMAVDANVLVFERIREELRIAKSPARAIELGFDRALSAIIDANLTTLITAAVLFALGSGPVRGFGVVLFIGVVSSVFTAVYVTRLIITVWFNRVRPKSVIV